MENELTNEQLGAISRGIKLGEALIKDHPEIADLWREGMFAPAIVEELDIQTEYSVRDRVATAGVRYAIAGHNGSFNLDSYVGLIPKEERERLGREHMQENRRENGRENGRETYENKVGVHGRTAEQMSEDGRKGGRKGGRETYKNKVGVHGRTAEQMSEDGRKAYEKKAGAHGRTAEQHSEDGREGGLKSAIAQGKTPWVREGIPEIEYAHALTFLPEFQRGSLVNNELIALELNIEYHDCEEVRNARAVSTNLYQYRKSLENRV